MNLISRHGTWFALLLAIPFVAASFGEVAGVRSRNPGSVKVLASVGGQESEGAASLEVPLLPAAPGGLSIPLPPMPSVDSKTDRPAPEIEANNLTEGIGKFAKMVKIPAGALLMGSPEREGRPDERPTHNVFLKDFHIAKHEVTVKEYCDFLNARGDKSRVGTPRIKMDSPYCPIEKNGRYFQPKPGMTDKPVVCVSWHAAVEFAEWAGGRLPTSAEWERAAVLSTPFQPGDYLTVLSRDDTVPVSIATPGLQGITGMLGNVWEWCSDWYAEDYYGTSVANNPAGPPIGKEKVLRGGSWASPEASKRIRNIHRADPNGYYRTVGFRIVKD